MVKRSKRMEPIKELVELREKNAARQLAECRRELAERQTRLSELTTYRDSYIDQQDLTGNIDPVRFQEYRLFLGRLNHAIKEQQRLVDASEEDCNNTHGEWTDTVTRSKAIEKAVGRFKRTEQEIEDRREQKEDDEAASSRYSPENK